MALCPIGYDSQRKLRVAVTHEMFNMLERGDTFSLKKLTKDIYEKMKEFSDDQNKALNYARMVPRMVNQIQSVDPKYNSMILEAGVEAAAEVMMLSKTAVEDNTLKTIYDFLGIDDATVRESLEMANDNPREEIPQEENPSATQLQFDFDAPEEFGVGDPVTITRGKNKGTKTEVVEDEGTHLKLKNGRRVLKKSVERIKPEKRVKKEPEFENELEEARAEAEEVTKDSPEAIYNALREQARANVPAESFSYETLRLLEDGLVTGTLTPEKAQDVLNHWKSVQSTNPNPTLRPNQIARFEKLLRSVDQSEKAVEETKPEKPTESIPTTPEDPKAIKGKLEKVSKEARAESKEKQAQTEKKVEEVKPKDVMNTPSAETKVTEQNGERVWKAGTATMLTDGEREANENRIPYGFKKFVYRVKRMLIRELKIMGVSDSSKLNLNGRKIFLTAMRAEKVETDPAFEYAADDVILVVTDEYGNPLHFDENLKIVDADQGGQISYSKFRTGKNLLLPNGTINHNAVKNNIAALRRQNKELSYPEAAALVQKEVQFLAKVEEYIAKDPNNTVQFVINSGSEGYVARNRTNPQPLKSVKVGRIKIADKADVARDPYVAGVGIPYYTSDDLDGHLIEIELPGVEQSGHSETLKSLIFDELKDPDGKPLEYEARRQTIRSMVNVAKGSRSLLNLVKNETSPIGYDVYLGNDKQKIDVSSPEGIAAGKQLFDNEVAKKRGEFYVHKIHVNKQEFATGKMFLPSVDNGTVSFTEMKPMEFLGELGTEINTPDVAEDGTIRKVNAYYRISPSAQGQETLYGVEQQKTAKKAAADEQLKRTKELSKKARARSRGAGTPASRRGVKGMLDKLNNNPKKNKILAVKNGNRKVTEQEIDVAKQWYENHPMSKHIPFEAMFDMVNNEDPNAIATWALNGITLFKGSDYTDIYHEAWHGFTQTFMTPEQRAELYAETRKLSGRFKGADGITRSFRIASEEQLEEYLAEEFRKFMLNGRKTVKNAPKRTSFFRRVWNTLVELFTGVNHTEVSRNANAMNNLNEIFEKLKIGNFSEYSFNTNNVQFTELNKGILSIEAAASGIAELGYNDSQKVLDMVDQFLGEYIDIRNNDLNFAEIERLRYLEDLIRNAEGLPEKSPRDAEGNIKSDEDGNPILGRLEINSEIAVLKGKGNRNKTYHYSGQIARDKDMLTEGYEHALSRLVELQGWIEEDITELMEDAEENAYEIGRLNKQFEMVTFVIENFGDTEDIMNNRRKKGEGIKGVIGYHMYKSKVFTDTVVKLENEDISEDKLAGNSRTAFERRGNDESIMDLAKDEIVYLIKTLPGYVKENGRWVEDMNDLGIRNLADFTTTWNKMIRATENMHDAVDMYNRLANLAVEYPPVQVLLDRLGSPSREGMTLAENRLWTNIFQTFKKARIPLVQVTIHKKMKDGNTIYESNVGEAFNADSVIGKEWQARLDALPQGMNPYIGTDKKGNYINVEAILEDFSPADLKDKAFEFYKAIGFDLTDNREIREALIEHADTYTPVYFYERLQTLKANRIDRTKTSRVDPSAFQVRTLAELVGDSNKGRYTQLQKLEAQYSDVFTNFMVTNAEGNAQFEHSLHNTLTMMISSLNAAGSYQELIAMPHMTHLDIDKNPLVKNSIWLNSMFDLELDEYGKRPAKWGTRKFYKNRPVTMKMSNLSGILLKDEETEQTVGVSSASSDEYSKLIMDLHLGFGGVFELMRHADKSTSYAIGIDGILMGAATASESFISPSDIMKGTANLKAANLVLPHLLGEMARIKKMKNLSQDNTLKNYDFNYVKDAQKFTVFDDVLSNKVKKKLYDIIDTNQEFTQEILGEDLTNQIREELREYFKKEHESIVEKYTEAPFIANNVKKELNSDKYNVPASRHVEVFTKLYAFNSWIGNLESAVMFYGDLTQYDHSKDDFHKRNAGAGSTGTVYRTDSWMGQYIDSLYSGSYAAANADKLGIDSNPYEFNGRFKTAVVEKMGIESVYTEEYRKHIGDKAGKYGEKQDEADAQGLITFDAYRQLKLAEGTWTDEHQALFNTIVKGGAVETGTVAKFFPVIKGQYWGPLQTDHMPVTAFHKYSLFPMIPTVIKGKNMETLHNKMVQEGIAYVTFTSGSKVGTITKSKDSGYDKLYGNQKNHTLDEGIMELDPKNQHFTPNIIFLEYFKNQLEIHDEYKGKVIFSTQLRKLIEDGLMENGVPTDFMTGESDVAKRQKAWAEALVKGETTKRYDLLTKYEKYVSDLTYYAKGKLLRQIGWTSTMVDGNEVLTGDTKNLMRLVKDELERQDLGEHSVEFLDVDKDGRITNDISLHLSVEKIEKLLTALMVKRLVKQKVNGEALIQVATSLMEDQVQPGKLEAATDEQMKKWGSNDLPFYSQGATGNEGVGVPTPEGLQDRMTETLPIIINPNAKKHVPKELVKTRMATQFIGDGSTGSSTDRYKKMYAAEGVANTGVYGAGDVVYVSSNGKRNNRVNPVSNGVLQGEYKNVQKAMDAGATIVMDTSAHLAKTSRYNIGEVALADYLANNGYERIGESGVWKPKNLKTGPTKAMKVKIALQNDFRYLLDAMHLDGQKIETLDRLNQMVKSEEWLDTGRNREMITMVGVRIPVQGLNSMEFMEVYEFLPEEAGSIIVPPTEIVTKSGADFDVDKMTVMMPNIDRIDGKPQLYNSGTPKGDEQALKLERKEVSAEIKEIQRKYDDIFARRDKKNEFAFDEDTQNRLKELDKDIAVSDRKIKDLTSRWQNLSILPKSSDTMSAMYEIEEDLNQEYVNNRTAQDRKWNLIKTSKQDIVNNLTRERQEALEPLFKKKNELSSEINALSDKAIQNNIMATIKEILALPENFKSLITPNDVDLLEKPTKVMEPYVSEYNPKARRNGEEAGKMSPTRVLEAMHNLHKHSQNNIGKQTLGLGAVDNTYNTLFNRIGAHMEAYTGDVAEYRRLLEEGKKRTLKKSEQKFVDNFVPQKLFLNHNSMEVDGEKVISLSHTLDASNQNSIADVVNQMINGWVDIAKGAWIFNIQGNKEVSPVLLFLIQAGVPVEEAVYFVSNPLIREYVKQQKLAKSTLAEALETMGSDRDNFRFQARMAVLQNPKYGFKFNGKTSAAVSRRMKQILSNEMLTGAKLDPALTERRAKQKLSKFNATEHDRKIFMHYLQIEDMAKSVRDFKMRTNVDTSRDVSLFEAQDRNVLLEELRRDGRLPASMVDKVRTNSPISSFFIQDFQINLLGRLFPLRNHKTLNGYIKENVDKQMAESTFGNREVTVINWKSDLVSYMFQNELRYFKLNRLTHYNSMELAKPPVKLEGVKLERGAYVKDGVMYVDKDALKKQYESTDETAPPAFTQANYHGYNGPSSLVMATFDNENEYQHYVLEREFLRSQTSLKDLENSFEYNEKVDIAKEKLTPKETESSVEFAERVFGYAFELYLSDKALDNIHNHWKIFKSGQSFAQQFVNIRESFPELKKEFALLNLLDYREGRGYKNLIVQAKLEGDIINVLHENLQHLSSLAELREILPGEDDATIQELVSFFKRFDVVAFLQSGMNTKSSYAMTPFVSQDRMMEILKQPVHNLMTLLERDDEYTYSYLETFNNMFKTQNRSSARHLRIRGKNYNSNTSLMDSKSILHEGGATKYDISDFFKDTLGVDAETSTYGEIYGDDAKTRDAAKAVAAENPDITYVYELATENTKGGTYGSAIFHGAGVNTVGLPVKKAYSGAVKFYIYDVDGKVDPAVKTAIDNAINQLKLEQDRGQRLAFSREGYGKYMLSEQNGKYVAPQTFLYLSEQLYKNFKYVNPGYLRTQAGKGVVLSEQTMTDQIARAADDQEVKEFMKQCLI